VAEVQELAGGRADLPAEVAGIFEGAPEGEPDAPLPRLAAQLCRKAGADPEAIPASIEEGRRLLPPGQNPRRATANERPVVPDGPSPPPNSRPKLEEPGAGTPPGPPTVTIGLGPTEN